MKKKLFILLFLIGILALGCHGKKNDDNQSYNPPTPDNITVKAADGYLDVSWSDVEDADSFIVIIRTDVASQNNNLKSTSLSSVVTISENHYRATNLVNGDKYTVSIASVNSYGRSKFSQAVFGSPAKPAEVPDQPTNFNVTTEDTDVNLSWSPVQGADGYHVYMAINGSGDFRLIDNTASFFNVLKDLIDGQSYDLFIKAFNSKGESQSSNIVKIKHQKAITPPMPPTNLNIQASDGYAILTWDKSYNAAGYIVYMSSSESGQYVAEATTTKSKFKVSQLVEGTTYWFKVAALNSFGVGQKSEPVMGTPMVHTNPPAKVIGLTAIGDDSKVNLAWLPSGDILSYNVYIATSERGPYSLLQNTGNANYNVTGLINNQVYWFKVTGVNAAGEGPLSSVAVAFTQIPIITPNPPASINITSGDSVAIISWNNIAGASSYTIYGSSSISEPFNPIVTTTLSPYTITGLSNGIQYYFAVGANNGVGTGTYSTPVSVIPNPPSPGAIPPVPTDLTGTGGNGTANLAWSMSSGATSYNIYQSLTESGNYVQIKNSASNSSTISGLVNDRSYWFKITALNSTGGGGGGESALSSPASVYVTAPIVVPTAPTGVTSNSSNESVTISWEHINGVQSYVIYQSNSETGTYTNIASTANNSFTVTGLTNGSTYWFKIAGRNTAGEGTKSLAVSGVPVAPIIIPTTPSWLSTIPGDGYVDLIWSASTEAVSYNVYKSSSRYGSYRNIKTNPSNSVRISGLQNGVVHWFKITASNSAGESPLSNEISVTPIAPIVPPIAPSGINTTSGDKHVNLSWNSVLGTESYVIYQSSDNLTFNSVETTTSSQITIEGLTNGRIYYFKIKGQNTAGASPFSLVVSSVPQDSSTPPPSPILTSAEGGNKDVILRWNRVNEARYYNIYMSSDGGHTYNIVKDDVSSVIAIIGDLTNGVEYYFRLTTVNRDGLESLPSEALSATPNSPKVPPVTPMAISTFSDNQSIILSWAPAAGASSYNVYISNNKDDEYEKKANRTMNTHKQDNLTNGKEYWFKISAVNNKGESSLSSPISCIPNIPKTLPETPTGLTATPSDSSVALAWKDVPGATYYDIYVTYNNGGSYILIDWTESLNFTATSLTNGISYSFAVSAVNVKGESSKSVIASAMPLTNVIPGPSGLNANGGAIKRGILLTWNPVTWNNGKDKPDGYIIYMSKIGKDGYYKKVDIVKDGTIYKANGLIFLNTYWFKIKAYQGSSESAFSASAFATVSVKY